MRRSLMVSVLALALAAGCGGEKKPEAGAGPTEPAAPAAPSFDASGIKAKLQGTWVSGSEKKDYFKFVFEGDKVSVTDMRFGGEPKTISGDLKLTSPFEIGVATTDGATYKYAMAEIEGTLHLGLGAVFEVKGLDNFEIATSTFDKIVKTGDTCKWAKDFGGKKEEKAVTCGVADQDGKKVFTYQEPSSFDKDKMADKSLFVFGNILLDEEMLNSVAKKQ